MDDILNESCDKMMKNLKYFFKSKVETDFSTLTAKLFPCSKANEAYNAIVGSTCGNEGAVNLLLGLSYILSLNVLFISLLYLSLFILAFVQDVRIQMIWSAPIISINYYQINWWEIVKIWSTNSLLVLYLWRYIFLIQFLLSQKSNLFYLIFTNLSLNNLKLYKL